MIRIYFKVMLMHMGMEVEMRMRIKKDV